MSTAPAYSAASLASAAVLALARLDADALESLAREAASASPARLSADPQSFAVLSALLTATRRNRRVLARAAALGSRGPSSPDAPARSTAQEPYGND